MKRRTSLFKDKGIRKSPIINKKTISGYNYRFGIKIRRIKRKINNYRNIKLSPPNTSQFLIKNSIEETFNDNEEMIPIGSIANWGSFLNEDEYSTDDLDA